MILDLFELLGIGFAIAATSFGLGFKLSRYIFEKEYKQEVINDTCLNPRGSIFGNLPYKMQRIFFNDKCRDVICEFRTKDKKCTHTNKKCIYIE